MSLPTGDIRRWRRLLVIAGIALALLQVFRAFHGAQTHFITNDGDWYYAYTVSLYFDHDLDLSNQMATWARIAEAPPPPIPSGRPTPTAFTVGPALLWLPAFALADLTVVAAREFGLGPERNGYALPYQLAVAWATLVYGLIGVWLALRAALWWAGSPEDGWRQAAPIAAGAALCGSPALYYLFFEPTMAHGLSLFSASLLVWVWLKTGQAKRWRAWAAVGLAGGLCALIRPQDCLLLLLPLVTIVSARPVRWLPRVIPLVMGAAIAFLPQMLVWWLTFGRPFTLPQGMEFLAWKRPALLQVWFSPHHGLFTWTPLWLLALLGLTTSPGQTRRSLIALFTVFFLESYVNAAARDWWAGDAFGARRFLSLFPVFVLGLSSIASRWGRRSPSSVVALMLIAVAGNLALMAAYVTGRIPHG